MSNNKQSSVELFIEQLEGKGNAWENASIRRVQISIDVSDYLELKRQAKAIHKEEIEIAFAKSYLIGVEGVSYDDANKASDKYYNETYGGNNE